MNKNKDIKNFIVSSRGHIEETIDRMVGALLPETIESPD